MDRGLLVLPGGVLRPAQENPQRGAGHRCRHPAADHPHHLAHERLYRKAHEKADEKLSPGSRRRFVGAHGRRFSGRNGSACRIFQLFHGEAAAFQQGPHRRGARAQAGGKGTAHQRRKISHHPRTHGGRILRGGYGGLFHLFQRILAVHSRIPRSRPDGDEHERDPGARHRPPDQRDVCRNHAFGKGGQNGKLPPGAR